VNVLILGTGERARKIAERFERGFWGRARVCGFLDDSPTESDLQLLGDRYLGKLNEIRNVATTCGVERVVYALPRRFLADPSISNVVSCCEIIGIEVTISLDLFETRSRQVLGPALDGMPTLMISPRAHHRKWKLAVKRAMDIGLSLIAILMTLPLWLAAAIAIKLESSGPVFFIQPRSGRFGKLFPCLKFRTMQTDAEEVRKQLVRANEMSGPVFKIRDDPRITRVGKVLRRYSIDELPQLLNVLVGHMSMVGPRPPLPDEVRQYEIDQRARLSMRPGLTCLWQVSGRNEIPFGDWVKMDIEYIERWSLWLDLHILLLTIPAVLSGRGAS